MNDDIETRIMEIVQPAQWQALQPILHEAFKMEMSIFLVDFVMKQVDRRIYEPIFIEALKKPDPIEEAPVPGKDSTVFEQALHKFKELRTGEPQKSFNSFLLVMQQADLMERIRQIIAKEGNSDKIGEIEALYIENQDILRPQT